MGQALAGKKYWISGVRADQSHYRKGMQQMSWNEKYQLYKFFPLFYWSEEDVWDFIHHYELDVNPLHHKGYPSIGCEPCTRAIKPGEDPRAGRWWWEQKGNKECGMHQG
ncbi:MAG: phosphoadenosine phosphosulfate reductase family protein [Bacteroidota bacterium]